MFPPRQRRERGLVQILLREVADGFGRSLLDLGLDLRSLGAVIHEDAELTVLNEEAPRTAITVLLEGHGLDGEIDNVTADHDPYEAEQTARHRLVDGLGCVLHNLQPKHWRKGRKGLEPA